MSEVQETIVYFSEKSRAVEIIGNFNDGSKQECTARLREIVRKLKIEKTNVGDIDKWEAKLKCGEKGTNMGAEVLAEIKKKLSLVISSQKLQLAVAEKDLQRERETSSERMKADAIANAENAADEASSKQQNLGQEIKVMFKEQTKVITEAGGNLLQFVKMLKFGVGWSVPLGLADIVNPKLPGIAIICGPLPGCLSLLVKVRHLFSRHHDSGVFSGHHAWGFRRSRLLRVVCVSVCIYSPLVL